MPKIAELLKIRIINFGSIREAEIDLSQDKLLLILGKNNDEEGCSSNGCLVGSTLIDCPRDLVKYPKGIAIRDLVGTTPYVYTYDGNSMVIKRASEVFLSKKNVPIIKVIVTKYATKHGSGFGEKYIPPLELVGTPDHLVLLSDGHTWKRLGELVPGDKLFSLYRRVSSNFVDDTRDESRIYWTGMQPVNAVREARMIMSCFHTLNPEYHVHHIDENKLNHTIDNLEYIGRKAHLRGHTRQGNLNRTIGWQKYGEHPRGMLGKKHTEKTKDVMRQCSKQMWEHKHNNEINHTVLAVYEPLTTADVYDMTVPETHNFVANGIVVHNSGKSTILHAHSWCLCGAFHSMIGVRSKKDEVIHDKHKRDCSVEELYRLDDIEIKIARYRKHEKYGDGLRLEINGEDHTAADVKITQKRIEELLNFTYESLVYTRMFGQDLPSDILSCTDVELKRILEPVFQTSKYEESLERTKKLTKNAEERLAFCVREATNIQQNKTQQDEWLKQLEQAKAMHITQIDTQIAAEEKELQDITNLLTQEGIKYKDLCRTRDALVQVLNKVDLSALKEHERELWVLLGTKRQIYKDMDNNIKLLSKRSNEAHVSTFMMEEGQTCPTCFGTVSHDNIAFFATCKANTIVSLEQELNEAYTLFATLATEINNLDNRVQRIGNITNVYDKLSGKLDSVTLEIESCSGNIRQLEASLITKKDQINVLETKKMELTLYDSQIQDAVSKIAQCTTDIVNNEVKIAKLQELEKYLSFWIKGFGVKGILSLLLQAVLPALNQRIAFYVNQFFSQDVVINFRAKETIMGYEFASDILIGGKKRSSYLMSGGERRRLNISVLFALKDLCQKVAPCYFDTIWVDELFDGFDSTGIENAIELLEQTVVQDLQKKIPVKIICISHDSSFKSQFDNILLVEKTNGDSVVTKIKQSETYLELI